MNHTLITILAIAAAIGIAMAIMAWRIQREQYPPELRWPKREKSRGKGHSKAKRDEDSRK